MIKFAKNNYKRDTVKYVTADICDEWHKLKKKLSLRKQTVDLVISIYCLHWVSDLKQAMDNIAKLLKPGFISKLSKHLLFYCLSIQKVKNLLTNRRSLLYSTLLME
jgi:ubiquinone/menaquinone biosynthesis C-methylase UbiE